MIDEFNLAGSGWARFSDDRTMRYRLARAITPAAVGLLGLQTDHLIDECACAACIVDNADPEFVELTRAENVRRWRLLRRVVFVLVNPSTADAFKPDPTVSKCCQFAAFWGADVLEVVNVFALRSTDPRGLDVAPSKGDDLANDHEIFDACDGATRVIAAWGNNAWRGGRGPIVASSLRMRGVKLECFGLTGEGFPRHPLGRGKGFIPLDREPVALPHLGAS